MILLQLTGRIEQADLLTSVGNHITEKTKRTFPRLADRFETTYNGIDPQEFLREKDYVPCGNAGLSAFSIAALFPAQGIARAAGRVRPACPLIP